MKDMELESMIEKLQEVLVESISVATRLWDVEMVLRVGGEDDGRKREGVTRPEGGGGHGKKNFQHNQKPHSWRKKLSGTIFKRFGRIKIFPLPGRGLISQTPTGSRCSRMQPPYSSM